MLLESAREQIAQACSHLKDDGLVVGTAGNISIREGKLVAITPSGLPYPLMQPELIAVVDYDTGTQVEGPLRPASELDLHLTTMRVTDKHAVIHTHSPAATTVASLEGVDVLPAVHYYVTLFGGPDVRVAKYATYGSSKLAKNVEVALQDRTGALMSNHGSIVAADDLDTAYTLATELEWVCDIYLRALASGKPRILSDQDIAHVKEKLAGYGQTVPDNTSSSPGNTVLERGEKN